MKRYHAHRGFTLIELLIVIAVIAVLASIAIPSMIESRKGANETSAVATLHTVTMAQESYRNHKSSNTYGTMDQLYDDGLVDGTVHSGRKSGYTFTLKLAPGASSYTVTAVPDTNAGHRYFYLDASGIIRANEDAPATPDSPPIS